LGFAHSGRKGDGLNLGRIDPFHRPENGPLHGMTVVFLARVPKQYQGLIGDGTCVVGWYENATLYDTAEHPGPDPQAGYYNMESTQQHQRRISFAERSVFKLSGPLGIGQMNVRYPYNESGELLPLGPFAEVLRYIDNCQQAQTENVNPETIAQLELDQGAFQKDPLLRKALEYHAMEHAEDYYTRLGYHVTRKGKPYDLLCLKGEEVLFVEVKGTTSKGSDILLTRNERKQTFVVPPGHAELFVLRDVRSVAPGVVTSGIVDIYPRWNPNEHSLSAYQYTCELDEKRKKLSFPIEKG
jgi:hypothetical protein